MKAIKQIHMPRPKVYPTAQIPSYTVIKKNVDFRAMKLRRLY